MIRVGKKPLCLIRYAFEQSQEIVNKQVATVTQILN